MSEFSQQDLDSSSLLLASDGRKSSIDDRSIHGLPAPLAASTVARPAGRISERYHDGAALGSFLEGDQSSRLSDFAGMEHLGFGPLSLSGAEGSLSRREEGSGASATTLTGQPSNISLDNRSSLGILNMDSLPDTTGSLLDLDIDASPRKTTSGLWDHSPRKKKAARPELPRLSEESPSRVASYHGMTPASLKADGASSMRSRPSRDGTKTSATPNMETSGASESTPVDPEQPSQVTGPVKSRSMPVLDLCGGMMFGKADGEDLDGSVMEVQLADEELDQIDADFSDIGDFDNTMTDDLGPSFHGLPKLSTEATLEFQSGRHALDDLPNHSQEESLSLGQRWEATGDHDDDLQFRSRAGEGQEDGVSAASAMAANKAESGLRRLERLNSMYLRGSSQVLQHDGGDGEEGMPKYSVGPTKVTPARTSDKHVPDILRHGRRASIDSSEIDTDDEIAAVRNQQSQWSNQRLWSGSFQRPGLEGVNPADVVPLMELRQSAEGDVVTSPVPGDGGGGGDGSSGHSSEDDSGHGGSLVGGSQQHTTLDVLRGLGFSSRSSSFGPIRRQPEPMAEDNPEAQQRIRPMGDDLLSEMAPRHVRFASPSPEVRTRTLSGASADDEASVFEPDPDTDADLDDNDLGASQASRLDSQFLLPSSLSRNSTMRDSSIHFGLDESSFNLANHPPGAARPIMDGPSLRLSEGSRRGSGPAPRNEEDSMFATGAAGNTSPSPFGGMDRVSFGDMPAADDFKVMSPATGSEAPSFDEEKVYLEEESPVYVSKEGDVVTDLAYQTSLSQLAGQNPFDSPDGGGVEVSGFGVDFGDGFDSPGDDFIGAEDALKMIDKDEQEFQQENVIMQEDAMDNVSLDLPDSWMLQSSMNTVDPQAAYCRLSIGAFLGTKSEYMGMLDGSRLHSRNRVSLKYEDNLSWCRDSHCKDKMPNFGTKVTTPPEAGRPVSLLPQTSPTLEEIRESEGRASEDVRGSGVGSDVDVEVGDRSKSEASSTTKPPLSPVRNKANTNQQRPAHPIINSNLQTPLRGSSVCEDDLPKSQSSTPISGNVGPPMTEDLCINISAISRLITSASADADPSDLVGMILQASTMSAAGKSMSKGKSEGKLEESKVEEKPSVGKKQDVSMSKASKDQRRPDGKSHQPGRGSLGLQKPGTQGKDRTSVRGSRPANLPGRESKDSSSSVVGVKKSGSVRSSVGSRSSISGDGRRGSSGSEKSLTRSKTADGEADKSSLSQRRSFSSKIPVSRKSSDSAKSPSSPVPSRAANRSSIQQRSSEGTSDVMKPPKPKELPSGGNAKKVQIKPTPTVTAAPEEPPVTPEEKIHKPLGNPLWKSPRPSSVFTRSKRDLEKAEESMAEYPEAGSKQDADVTSLDSFFLGDQPDTESSSGEKCRQWVAQSNHNLSQHLQRLAIGEPTAGSQPPSKDTSMKDTSSDLLAASFKDAAKRSVDVSFMQDEPEYLTEPQLHSVADKRPQSLPSQQTPHPTISDSKAASTDTRHTPPPLATWHHELLPSGPAVNKPTLLTNQSLATTPFASQYLSTLPSSQPLPTHTQDSHFQPMNVSTSESHLSHTSPPCLRQTNLTDNWSHTSPARLSHTSVSHASPSHPRQTNLPLDSLAHTSPARLRQTSSPIPRGDYASDSVMYGSVMKRMAETVAPSMGSLHLGGYATRPPVSVLVEAPPEVRVPEVCCVGLSARAVLPISNPSRHWLNVELCLVRLLVNMQEQDTQRTLSFIMKEKVVVEPNTTENIEVIFAPRCAGAYVAEVHIRSSPVSDYSQVTKVPTVVTLQGIAEQPNIQVLTKDRCGLDFGALQWGGHSALPVVLVNQGRAALPVRLVIASNNSSWHCFSFNRYSGNNASIISQVSRSASVPLMGMSVTNYTLPPTTEGQVQPVHVQVYFKAPKRQMDKAIHVPAEEITARVMIEVDNPSSNLPLASVNLRAAVGTPRLHIPRDMEIMYLKAELGHTAETTVPLMNAGNIPMEVSLEVTHWPDFFTVLPSSLVIQPKCLSDIAVRFTGKPSQSGRFESLLLMVVEPDGPSFELPLCGEIGLPAPARPPASERQILCNRRHLVWGGVAIGKAVQQTLILRSTSPLPMKVQLQIRGKGRDFQLQSSFLRGQRCGDVKDIILRPQEDYPVHVLFLPSMVAGCEAKLQVKAREENSKYYLMLCGYGGVSDVVLDNVQSSEDTATYWASLGPLSVGNNALLLVNVRNRGSRAAYVKGLTFQDVNCQHVMSSGRLMVEPHSFCLQPGQTQVVAVVLKPMEREVVMSAHTPAIVATVAFMFGDELSRQRFRRDLVMKGANGQLADENMTKHVHFDVPYSNEELCPPGEGVNLAPTPCDQELFYSSMRRVSLALVATPPPLHHPEKPVIKETMMTMIPDVEKEKRHTLPLTGDSPPVRGSSHPESPPRKPLSSKVLFPSTDADVKDAQPEKEEDWVIQPQQLMLTTMGADICTKRVQIVNYSNRALNYELSWPGHCLIATPEQGKVPPKSSSILCVSPNSEIHKKGVTLPWSGMIHVVCGSEHKTIRVQIHREKVMDETLHPTSSESPQPLPADPGTPLLSISTPTTLHRKAASGGVRNNQETLHFGTTPLGKTSELQLDLKNETSHNVKWVISSCAPAYIRGEDSTEPPCRATYAAFWAPVKVGVLQPFATKQIPVVFSPRVVGRYAQFYEVRYESANILEKRPGSTKVECLGQGVPDSSPEPPPAEPTPVVFPPNVTTCSVDTNATMPTKDSRLSDLITIAPSEVLYNNCRPNEEQTIKVKLTNKDKKPHLLEFLPLKSPFVLKRSMVSLNLKPRYQAFLPIIFRPDHVGDYHCRFQIKTDLGIMLEIMLKGRCQRF